MADQPTYSGVQTQTAQGNPPPITPTTPHWVQVAVSGATQK